MTGETNQGGESSEGRLSLGRRAEFPRLRGAVCPHGFADTHRSRARVQAGERAQNEAKSNVNPNGLCVSLGSSLEDPQCNTAF